MLSRLVLNSCSSRIQFLSAGVTAMGHHAYPTGLTSETAILIRAQLTFFSHQKTLPFTYSIPDTDSKRSTVKQAARAEALLGLTAYQAEASEPV